MNQYRVYARTASAGGPVLQVRPEEGSEWVDADPYAAYSEIEYLRRDRRELAKALRDISTDAEMAANRWAR